MRRVFFKGSKLNRCFPCDSQISYMSWVAEGVLSKDQAWQNWKPRYFSTCFFFTFDAEKVVILNEAF